MITDIKELIDGLELDEFGAVTAMLNYITEDATIGGITKRLGDISNIVHERAEREVENADEEI